MPVPVTRKGRIPVVPVSADEHRRPARRDREVLGLEDFTDDDLAALEAARAPKAAKAFDHELKPE